MIVDRYARQIALIGGEGQDKLKNAAVLVIGAGGIGCPLLMYLAASGIGRLGFVEFDSVELTNLHRQIIYTENEIGKQKSEIVFDKLKALNSQILIDKYPAKLTLKNSKQIISNYDLIIDASDNFKTKYLVNDICCQLDNLLLFKYLSALQQMRVRGSRRKPQ